MELKYIMLLILVLIAAASIITWPLQMLLGTSDERAEGRCETVRVVLCIIELGLALPFALWLLS